MPVLTHHFSKKAAKSSATLHTFLYDLPSVQEHMIYQPVDKKYQKDKNASTKAEVERLERIINGP